MHKHPPAGHAVLCACVLKTCTSLRHMHKESFVGAKLLNKALSLEHEQVTGPHGGYVLTH